MARNLHLSRCFETLAECVDVVHVLATRIRLEHGPEFELDFRVLIQALLIEAAPKDGGGHGRPKTWHVFARVPFASATHDELPPTSDFDGIHLQSSL